MSICSLTAANDRIYAQHTDSSLNEAKQQKN